jgi:GGDEF domain-containing protein
VRATDGTPVGGSIGVAVGQGMDHRRLLAQADEAMYQAKQSGSGIALPVAS